MASTFTLADPAATGFQNSSHYDQYRPSYPAESVDQLLKHLNVAGLKDARIVEIASGTGKFTELLAARPEKFELVAVEPHANMRETLVGKSLAGVKVSDGDAAHIPIEDGWGDALITAQVCLLLRFDEKEIC